MELSERLEVNARTLRRDIDRLRELGYTIDSSTGPGGGYRLGAGSTTPPLLLDDDEAIAVAVALTVAAGSVSDLQDIALRVLMKLDQLLPVRLRRRLKGVRDVTLSLPSQQSVDHRTLIDIAAACRDHCVLVFKYRDRGEQLTPREVEPMRLVHTGRVWYLAAWDLERADWRTFRLDRLSSIKTGAGFTPRKPPEDFATQVSRAITSSPYRYRARIALQGPVQENQQRIPPWIGLLEADGADQSVLTIGGPTYEALTAFVVHAGVDFELLDPPEAAEAIETIGRRLIRGARRAKKKRR
jgi:predicted DNA-binding transcriptional regulator YafY